jgi:hypothetical protein
MSPHTVEQRRELGAFYTPRDLSQVLADWAVRSPTDHVLEPSFGGCGFLESLTESLSLVGCDDPARHIYGADIDAHAFHCLSEKMGGLTSVGDNRFIHRDFLKIYPSDFSYKEFNVVIGNPPYVSLHNMSQSQRESCFDMLRKSSLYGGSIGRNASLWAFFILHALSFLKDGGRTAWVLPSSLLHADYARAVLDIYRGFFKKIKVIKLKKRFFRDAGTDEVSVILLAEGFKKEKDGLCDISFGVADDVNSLRKLAFELCNKVVFDNYKYSILSKDCLSWFCDLKKQPGTTTLGELAKVVIGMVTGDNNTFIIDNITKCDFSIFDHDVKPVVSKFSQLTGIFHNKARHDKLIIKNERCLLVCPNDLSKNGSGIRSYLSRVDRKKRKTNRTFPKRKWWFHPDDGLYPDAFLSYMIHKGPRLVINSSKINCTNSIHRVLFKNKLSLDKKKAIACSMLSSFTQLSSEIEGRAYGSGVLKLEPTPAKNICLIMDDNVLTSLIKRAADVDHLLVNDGFDVASTLVDEIIAEALDIPSAVFDEFRVAVDVLRNERYNSLV